MKKELIESNIQSFLDVYNSEIKLSVKVSVLISLYKNLQYAKDVLEEKEFEDQYGKLYKNVSSKITSISDVKLHSKFLKSLEKLNTSLS